MSAVNSFAKISGQVTIRTRELSTGRILKELSAANKVVNTGLSAIAYLLANDETSSTVYDYRIRGLRVGTNPTPTEAGHVQLVEEVVAGRVVLDDINLVVAPGKLTITATLPDALGQTPVMLQEAGLFTQNGTMFARHVHAPLTTVPGVQFEYAWVLTFTA